MKCFDMIIVYCEFTWEDIGGPWQQNPHHNHTAARNNKYRHTYKKKLPNEWTGNVDNAEFVLRIDV